MSGKFRGTIISKNLESINLESIREICLSENFEVREYLPYVHADRSFFITLKHTRCIYSKGTCDTIPIESNDNGPSL